MMNKSDFLKKLFCEFSVQTHLKKNKFIKESKKEKDFYQDLLILFNEEKYSALINKVEPVLSQFKKSFKILHILGVALLIQEEFIQAEKVLTFAYGLQPNHAEVIDHLAIALLKNAKFKKAILLYLRSLALNEDRYETWGNLSACFNAILLFDYAKISASFAIKLKENYLEGFINLAKALVGLDDTNEAFKILDYIFSHFDPSHQEALLIKASILEKLQCYTEALEIFSIILSKNSYHHDALIGQTRIFIENHQYDKALVNCEMLLQQEGGIDLETVFNLKASALIGQGNIEAAHAAQLMALRCTLYIFRQHADLTPAPKPYMPVDIAQKALVALKKALDVEGVPFFLAYGTLLGVIRDGDLLPFDKDLDVGLPWNIPRDELINRLVVRHGFSHPKHLLITSEQKEWNIAILHQETGISIDLFFFKPISDGALSGFYKKPPVLWKFPTFRLTTIKWLGQQWNVPDSPENFLTTVYGDTWVNPDPYFDTVLSGKNLLPSSIPTAIYYGYARLFERIHKREWKKAAGYCRQLLALNADPLIAEIESWLNSIIHE